MTFTSLPLVEASAVLSIVDIIVPGYSAATSGKHFMRSGEVTCLHRRHVYDSLIMPDDCRRCSYRADDCLTRLFSKLDTSRWLTWVYKLILPSLDIVKLVVLHSVGHHSWLDA